MGSTCASIHVLWRGSSDDAVKAIRRACCKSLFGPLCATFSVP
jgi:hypothetical protein